MPKVAIRFWQREWILGNGRMESGEMVEGKFSCSIYSILVYLSCVILCFLFNELIFY